jgi:hypothetical protein
MEYSVSLSLGLIAPITLERIAELLVGPAAKFSRYWFLIANGDCGFRSYWANRLAKLH